MANANTKLRRRLGPKLELRKFILAQQKRARKVNGRKHCVRSCKAQSNSAVRGFDVALKYLAAGDYHSALQYTRDGIADTTGAENLYGVED